MINDKYVNSKDVDLNFTVSDFPFQFILNYTYTHNLCRYHFFPLGTSQPFNQDIQKRYNNMFNMSTYLKYIIEAMSLAYGFMLTLSKTKTNVDMCYVLI